MPLAAAFTERWLPQYSQFHAARDIQAAQLLDRVLEHAVLEQIAPGIGEDQKHALTWARTAELSGRGVPSRWQRSISLRMSASMSSRLT